MVRLLETTKETDKSASDSIRNVLKLKRTLKMLQEDVYLKKNSNYVSLFFVEVSFQAPELVLAPFPNWLYLLQSLLL